MGGNEAPRRAIAVIRSDIARSRRERYELNMVGLARRHQFVIGELLVMTAADTVPLLHIALAAQRHSASVIITPSLAHLSGMERPLNALFDLYTVARSRIYRRGRRWPRRR